MPLRCHTPITLPIAMLHATCRFFFFQRAKAAGARSARMPCACQRGRYAAGGGSENAMRGVIAQRQAAAHMRGAARSLRAGVRSTRVQRSETRVLCAGAAQRRKTGARR